MIAQAPVSFIVSVIVVSLLVWAVAAWGYGREMSLLRQQAANYKAQLSAVSPKEAEIERRPVWWVFSGGHIR